MEHTKKLMLIEPEVFHRINQANNMKPNIISKLDGEMVEVLKKKVDDEKKWLEYRQILQKYIQYAGTLKAPMEIPILEKEEQTENTRRQEISDILEHVPKTFRDKAKLLLNTVEKTASINWNSTGGVIIDNTEIPGTNIIDLVNDAVRSRKNFEPNGWKEFMTAIKKVNIPLGLIGNIHRREYLLGKSNSSMFTDDESLETTPEKQFNIKQTLPKKTPRNVNISSFNKTSSEHSVDNTDSTKSNKNVSSSSLMNWSSLKL